MSGRDEMLGRIRKALKRPPSAGVPPRDPGSLFPKLEGLTNPITPEERLSKFEEEFSKVAGSPHRASTTSELDGILGTIFEESQVTSAVFTRNPLLAQLELPARLRGRGKSVAQWPAEIAETFDEKAYRDQSFSAGVGISGVDFVLAETGSLVLSSQTEGSQLASLAPPVHVALYRREQILASLDEVLERNPRNGMQDTFAVGRSTVFITGPSRTADIEQILIRGVHGPKNVHAILVEESCLAEMAALKP